MIGPVSGWSASAAVATIGLELGPHRRGQILRNWRRLRRRRASAPAWLGRRAPEPEPPAGAGLRERPSPSSAALFLAAFFGAAFLAAFLAAFFAAFLAAFFGAPSWPISSPTSWRTSWRLLRCLLRVFFAATAFLAFLAFLLFFLLRFSHRGPPVAADHNGRSGVFSRRLSDEGSARVDQFNAGRGPPVAQSRSSIVCTTGTDVPLAICTMQPILPAAIMSGLTLAMLATLRSRNRPASSGWRML